MKTSTILTILLIGYFSILSFSCKKETLYEVPTLTTASATNVTSNSFISGGEIKYNGGATISAVGVCWSINQNPILSDNKTVDLIPSGVFVNLISGLSPATTYFFRAYAVNSAGASYGNQLTATTLALLPAIATASFSEITSTTATGGGAISSDGGSSVTGRGICWSKNQNPTTSDTKTTDGTGTGTFSSSITGLAPGTLYYFRAYATNGIGTAYGNQVTVSSSTGLPTLTTTALSSIAPTTASCGGTISSDGGAAITARGVCWSRNQNPTTVDSKTSEGPGNDNFTSVLKGLDANATYFVRAFAVNSIGTSYGNQISFSTSDYPNCGTLTDIDGNVYKTVTIGTQCWMRENLKSITFKDGSPIQNVNVDATWVALTKAAYSWYNNDAPTYKATYGAIYNWYAVNTANLCPTGWHVPSDADWTTLTDYLGDLPVAGGKLKETGTSHWLSPNTAATNVSGFTGLSGGARDVNGAFTGILKFGEWWSSTEYFSTNVWYRRLDSDNGYALRGSSNKKEGFSVRCLKD